MDETTTGSSTTTATRSSTRTRATPIPARSGATSNTTSRLETRPARSCIDLGSTQMGTSGATSRSAPRDSLEVSWAIPSCSPGSSPWSSQSSRSRSGRAADHGSLRNHRPSDIAPAQSTQPRSLLIASPYATPVTRLSDIGERGAIDILARIYDRGQPIGLGHDCGVVDWGDDYLVVTTDVVNRKTHIPTGATAPQIVWHADRGTEPTPAAVSADRRWHVLLRVRRNHELHGPLRRPRGQLGSDDRNDEALVPD